MKRKKIKICFASSSGGHFEQIMMLEPLMKKYNSFLLTERTSFSNTITDHKMYLIPQVNRKEKLTIIKLFWIVFLSLWIFIKERPNVVISTGVLATIPMCMLAKLFRRKLIYIESFAKISSPTVTGKLIYKFADQFYVQWEEMLKFYPKAIYLGSIY
jgi:beta-1,4-N-acetylglucosaminyltransferase